MSLPTHKFESLSRLSAKSDPYTLILNARHQFMYASYLEPSCTVFKTAIPSNIDIVACGKLVLSLSGHLDGSKISPDTYANSALGKYIVGFLRNNSADLAIEAVSDVFSDETGQTQIILTFGPTGGNEHPFAALQVILQSIRLDLTWTRCTKTQQDTSMENSVFSEQMSLPIQALVENVIGRFVTWHLVRRYPLIFGAWNKQLADETIWFRKIYRAISEIARRSPDNFGPKYKKIMKVLVTSISLSFFRERLQASLTLHSACIAWSSETLLPPANDDRLLACSPYLDVALGDVAVQLHAGECFLIYAPWPRLGMSPDISLRKQQIDAFISSRGSLIEYLQLQHDVEAVTNADIPDEAVFCLAMERLYRAGMKRPHFKGSTDVPMTSSDALDDDTLSHDHSLSSPSPSSPPGTPQDLLWDTLAISIPLVQGDLGQERYSWSLQRDARPVFEDLIQLTDDTEEDETITTGLLDDYAAFHHQETDELTTCTPSSVESLPGNRMSCDISPDTDIRHLARHQDYLESDWAFEDCSVGDFDFEEEMKTGSGEEGCISPVVMALDDADPGTHQVLEHGDEDGGTASLDMDDCVLFEERCATYDIDDVIL